MNEFNDLKDIFIGPIIKQKFVESSMSINNFSIRINCSRALVYEIFKRKSIDTELLIRISKELKYDFLHEIYLKKDIDADKTRQLKKRLIF